MGVHGLWKLLEPSGQMVPLESLAGKVLAVDVSIWLHQAMKGMHDAHGAPLAVAHLLILFHRLCKLLYYKIKPVFVFDGGVPSLKCQTMAARRQRSTAAKTEAFKVREKLIKNLLKHEAVRQVLSNETASAALGLNSFTLPGPSVEEDLYKLPPIAAAAADSVDSEWSEGATSSDGESERPAEDIHSVDVTSQDFLRLPAEVRHDILTELIETRKQSSWKFLDSMPKRSDSFSDFQMGRLLKRHAVQTSLEKAGKEMGGRALSLKELESLLGDQGVLDPGMDLPSRRIAQDSTTRYMLVQKESEAAPGEFDIMEHLEEVEWSSESDSDVVLESRSNEGKRVEAVEEGTDCKGEAESVRPTKEVADILSVLEEEDAKVKTENSQTEMSFSINSKASESETDVTETQDGCSPAGPEGPEASAGAAVPAPEDDTHDRVERKTTAVIGTVEEPNSDSCSDSDSDLVPITPAEMESALPQQDAPPSGVTVVINPSEASQKDDDLFADVFDEEEALTRDEEHGDDEQELRERRRTSIEALGKTLEEEHSHLMKEKGRQERHAMNITDQVYTDAQELLRLFGIPFVVAPMEAEAQCATLNALGLTEGTITDDSDIWLFGGRLVYKNFFNQNRHVLEYRSENIERKFKLTREEMIKMALLVGSDYTVGLSGIGPVTALEIIAAFQTPGRGTLEGLVKFRDWFTGVAKGGPARATLRRKIRNTVMTPGFPSRAVLEAYLNPRVDDSKEPFSWAKPNLDLIRKYARAKLGWSTEKCNDLLLPVLKKLEEKTSQTTIEKHFRVAQKSAVPDGMLSKRVENAIKRLGNGSTESEEPAQEDTKPRKKRKPNNGKHAEEGASAADSKSAMRPTCSGRNDAKLNLIKAKLHQQNAKVPQREMAQKLQEEKKKEAIRIFRTYGKPGKKKTKVFAKEEANLSESSSSSSEND